MWKWIRFILDLLRIYQKDIQAPQDQEIARSQEKLNDQVAQINQEVRDEKARAHQEIMDTQDLDGGRAAALARLERLRRGTEG